MMRGAAGKDGPPEKDSPAKLNKATLRRVARLFSAYKPQVLITVASVIISSLVGLLPFWFLKLIVDQGLAQRRLDVTGRYSLYTILVTIVASALTLLYGYLSVVVGQKIMRDLRNDL